MAREYPAHGLQKSALRPAKSASKAKKLPIILVQPHGVRMSAESFRSRTVHQAHVLVTQHCVHIGGNAFQLSADPINIDRNQGALIYLAFKPKQLHIRP